MLNGCPVKSGTRYLKVISRPGGYARNFLEVELVFRKDLGTV